MTDLQYKPTFDALNSLLCCDKQCMSRQVFYIIDYYYIRLYIMYYVL